MNKTGVIISGGTIDSDFAFKQLEQLNPEIIIGVDKGLTFLYENKLFNISNRHIIQSIKDF